MDEPHQDEGNTLYSLILWNDEKHTITDVQNHVARSCRTSEESAYKMAIETDSIGRSILKNDIDIDRRRRVRSVFIDESTQHPSFQSADVGIVRTASRVCPVRMQKRSRTLEEVASLRTRAQLHTETRA